MSSPERHLAQFNIARIKYPLDDPRMAEFVGNVERINGLAERVEGFVWRLKDDSGNAMDMGVHGDKRVLPNLTVWENVQALERFVWKTLHYRFYQKREDWFEFIEVTNAMWWVDIGARPSLDEGIARLDHLTQHGPTDFAFGWQQIAGAQHWKTARCPAPSENAA